MTGCRSRPSWPIGPLAAVLFASSTVRAGVWTIDPVFGLSGDYASNPALLDIPGTAAVNGAVLLDAPTAFNGDGYKWSLLPSLREGTVRGYSSVDSDYEHLTAKGERDTERSVLTGSLELARDSSLYFSGLTSGTTGVRHDSATVDLNFDRSMSERLDWSTDLNGVQVRYDQGDTATRLTNYRNVTLSPTWSWSRTQGGKFTFALSGTLFNALDGSSQSKSLTGQLGYVYQVTPLWNWSAQAGYSRAINKVHETLEEEVLTSEGPEIVLVPVNAESGENGTVFNVAVTRQSERLGLTLTAARQLLPSGFAYLSSQSSYELRASYAYTARWTLTADLRFADYQNPQIGQIAAYSVTTGNYSLQAAWQWTEFWTVTLSAGRITENAPSPFAAGQTIALTSNSVSVQLSRHFKTIKF